MAESQDSRIAALEAERDALRAELQHFTYAVSHDLRAPLRHILSYAQMVQEDAGPLLSEEVQEFLATITDSARHMGALLDGLAALSRVGSAPVNIGPVSLQELVQSACQTVAAQEPVCRVDWRVAADLPMVQADASLLHQALLQVLGNARKFSAPCAQPIVEVTVGAADNSDTVLLQVRDNGVGFNPAQQDQLFKVFGRLHSVRQFDGIGVGLVLARKLLERFGATVAIVGVLDVGCTVQLRLRCV